jgi:membrane-bound lytic murein transglycosylase
MTIHAQEGKSSADCLKQSWNTSRILTQEKTRPSQPTKSANKEATSNLPIGELVNKVIHLVEVGLAEFDSVKAVTAAKKMRANVAEIFGELVKAPSKEQPEAKSTLVPEAFRLCKHRRPGMYVSNGCARYRIQDGIR